MERLLYKQLLAWKAQDNRKPLLLQGARQVGKTYLLKEFAKNEYTDCAYHENTPNRNRRCQFPTQPPGRMG